MSSDISVFVDESGDLGPPAKGGSSHFIVCALGTTDPERLSRIPRRARGRERRSRDSRELKFRYCPDRIRTRVLREVSLTESAISWCAVDKRISGLIADAGKGGCYEILLQRALEGIAAEAAPRRVSMVLDKRNERWFRGCDVEGSSRRAFSRLHGRLLPPDIRLSLYDSHNSGGLQAADFVCGAVFQLVERGRTQYYSIVEGKMVRGMVIL